MSPTKMYHSSKGKEKSSFATTCNRLSLFLKEKGSLRGLEINANFDVKEKQETIDLLSDMKRPIQTSKKSDNLANPLPQNVSLDSLCKRDDLTNISGYNETGTKTAPMTIFYGGQVLVFDNISDDKARDLMLLASGGSIPSNQIQNRASTSNPTCQVYGSQEHIIPRPQVLVDGSDLPIARRASLHKFLARKKDRAAVRPTQYQSHNPLMAASSSKYKFDLNL